MFELSLFESDELLALARLDIEKNRIDAALMKLKQADKLPDSPSECDSLLAKLYAQLGLYARASYHYESFLVKEPEALLEKFQYGMLYFEQGIFDRAMETWREVLEHSPTYPPALFYCSLVSWESGQETEAHRLIDILLKSAPADNLYFKRGKELLQNMDDKTKHVSTVRDSQIVN